MSHTLLSHTKVTNTTTTEIDITGISQSYQDLCFWFVGHDLRTDVGWDSSELYIHLDGDTGSHYTHQKNFTVATTRYAGATDNGAEFMLGYMGNKKDSSNCGATVFGYIPAYTSTANYQGHTVYIWAGAVGSSTVGTSGCTIMQYTGQWTEETAIDEIKLSYPTAGSYFAQNSTFSLYGIENS